MKLPDEALEWQRDLEIVKRLEHIATDFQRREPDATFAQALLMIIRRLDDDYQREQSEFE